MGILERLDAGEVIIGDGSYVNTLEKRGYVKAGNYTPESSVEHPQAVEQLAQEFARAGADITQTFTYYSRDVGVPEGCNLTCRQINQASCDIAFKVARERGTIVAGGIVQTAVFKHVKDKPEGKAEVQKELEEGLEILIQNNIDLIIVEYFHNIREMEWAIDLALKYNRPVAATMCIGPQGDGEGHSPGECAIRMARAGAPIIGVNCLFGPKRNLETLRLMKEALDSEGLKPHLMVQPLGYHTPDAGRFGWITLDEFPFAMEPRLITRWEAARWAREAYDIGARAIAEELAEERGGYPEGSDKSDYTLKTLKKKADLGRPDFAGKGDKSFWWDMEPTTGRPWASPLGKARGTFKPSEMNI